MNDNETLILGKELKMDEEFCRDAIKHYLEIVREETAEKVRKEIEEEIRKEIEEKRLKEIAQDMNKYGYPIETIAKITHLDLETIKQII